MTCVFTLNITLPHVFFKHFGSKNRLPDLSIIETLVESGLMLPDLDSSGLRWNRILCLLLLREKCRNTKLFLVCIFSHLD